MLPRFRPARLWFFLTLLSSLVASAQMEEWKDAQGAAFYGEPSGVVGPFAVFRTGPSTSLRVRLSALSAADCARLYRAVSAQPPLAAHWKDAQGLATRELVGKMVRVDKHVDSTVDYLGLPEPELLLMIIRQAEDDREQLEDLAPFVSRLDRLYGGRIATVVAMPVARFLPISRGWLALDVRAHAKLRVLRGFIPPKGLGLVLMTRQGVPLLTMNVLDHAGVRSWLDAAGELLSLLDPDNLATAPDRVHYLRSTRLIAYAHGSAPPLPVGTFLRAAALRENRVERIEARIEVAADGKVTQVTVSPGPGLPEALRLPLGAALRRSAIFAPAMKDGQPVAGVFDYAFEPGWVDKQLDADRAWLSGEVRADILLPDWLVLKPVRVDERDFIVTAVDKVGVDGTLLLKPVSAGGGHTVQSERVQLKSFDRDWFSLDGPASVHPKAGDRQEVDDQKLTWKILKSRHGLVDFMEGARLHTYNYCYGYAWTEFDSPEARDAWLGIGSDDGLKVWFNGELVDDHWVARISRLDEDVVPVRLKQGKNAILIKIQNIGGLWSFTARLRTRS